MNDEMKAVMQEYIMAAITTNRDIPFLDYLNRMKNTADIYSDVNCDEIVNAAINIRSQIIPDKKPDSIETFITNNGLPSSILKRYKQVSVDIDADEYNDSIGSPEWKDLVKQELTIRVASDIINSPSANFSQIKNPNSGDIEVKTSYFIMNEEEFKGLVNVLLSRKG